DVTPVNDPPQVTLAPGNPVFVQAGDPVALFPLATIGDVELEALNDGAGDWRGATLIIARQGGADSRDVLGLLDGGRFDVADEEGGTHIYESGVRLGSVDSSTPGQWSVVLGGSAPV